MVENIHDRRAAIKDAVATLTSHEKPHSRKRKIPTKQRITVQKQLKIYEKSKHCRPELFESKKKYTASIMRNRKRESANNRKSVKIEKSKRSTKIVKKTKNGICTAQNTKIK
ncbi:unnamed protein product [Meganyctiphanes norvegica]|uniref:Uncharacterized protein n=1 Tax=Meganyctiphanes norvegica TaxID=48144 RepID=A0AAV2R8D0_MEGNR